MSFKDETAAIEAHAQWLALTRESERLHKVARLALPARLAAALADPPLPAVRQVDASTCKTCGGSFYAAPETGRECTCPLTKAVDYSEPIRICPHFPHHNGPCPADPEPKP